MTNLNSRERLVPRINSSYLDQACTVLHKQGSWSAELQPQDLQVILAETVQQLLLANFQDKVLVENVSQLVVTVAPSTTDGRSMLTVATHMFVTRPIRGQLLFKANFKNGPDGQLDNTGLTLKEIAERPNAALLGALEIAKVTAISPVLSKPDQLFLSALNQQMGLRDTVLTGGRFTINPNSITIDLTGGPKAS